MQPELLDKDRCALVLIDVQERLFPSVHECRAVLAKIDVLLTAAKLLGIPLLLTEQYPKGLGDTLEEIKQIFPEVRPLVKTDFSCVGVPGFMDSLASLQRDQILLAGIETHICVAQTALELASNGMRVFIIADATSSRRPLDAQTALRRLEQAGLTPVTVETVVFEWLRRAGTEEFKKMQPKIKALAEKGVS